jgi:hypothetical protein
VYTPGHLFHAMYKICHSRDLPDEKSLCRTVVTWVAAALIFLIAASKYTAIAVVGGAYPIYGNVLKAGVPLSTYQLVMHLSVAICSQKLKLLTSPLPAAYKNFSVKNSAKRFVGIWHAQILSMSIEDSYPGNDKVKTSLKLSIGEPGVDGFSSELQVPWSPGYVSYSWYRKSGVFTHAPSCYCDCQ